MNNKLPFLLHLTYQYMNVCFLSFHASVVIEKKMRLIYFTKPCLKSLIFKGKYMVMACALLGVLSADGYAQSRGGGRGANVELAPAESEELSSTTTLPASVTVQNSYVVNAPSAGIVETVDLKIGSMVEKGSLIGQMDVSDERYQISLLSEQLAHINLQLAQIQSNLAVEGELKMLALKNKELAAARLSRAEQLSQKQVVSADTVESTTQALISAEQQIVSRQQAQMRLEQQSALLLSDKNRITLQINKLKSDIAEATIKAPVSGQIVRFSNSPKQFVREGDIIAEIQDMDGFEIAADIPSELIRYLNPGQSISANTPAGQKIDANLRAILPQHNQRTGTRAVRITPQSELPVSIAAEGAQLTVQIPNRTSGKVVTIPKDALLPIEGRYVVFVAEDGKAMRRNVTIGGTSSGRIIVLGGVDVGEQVVIKGNEGLSDGQALRQGGGNKPAQANKAPPKPDADAENWALSWQTRRGESTAQLVLSQTANLYNGEPIQVSREGAGVQFSGEATLPFGIVELKFDGQIDGAIMSGTVTILGLPNGNEPQLPFQGKRVKK